MQISLTQDPLMLIFYMVKCDNSVKCVTADFLRSSYVLGLERCSVVKNGMYIVYFFQRIHRRIQLLCQAGHDCLEVQFYRT